MLGISTLQSFKFHVDKAYDSCLLSVEETDSARLIDKKVSCFFIAICDRLQLLGLSSMLKPEESGGESALRTQYEAVKGNIEECDNDGDTQLYVENVNKTAA